MQILRYPMYQVSPTWLESRKGLGAGVVNDPEQFEGIHDMERRAIVMNRTEFQQTNPPDNALI